MKQTVYSLLTVIVITLDFLTIQQQHNRIKHKQVLQHTMNNTTQTVQKHNTEELSLHHEG